MKTYAQLVNEAKENIQEIELEEAKTLIEAGNHMVLDVREPFEFAAGHIKGAINVPRGVLESAADLDYHKPLDVLKDNRNANWIVVCRTAQRSAFACETLQHMGFTSVVNMLGGMRMWKKSGNEISTDEKQWPDNLMAQ